MGNGVSILVYGRNDNHGYNIVRRAALSLNAIAHALCDGDEILFCDCNTPDALPTFPEAISDTLTERAREYLRVIRVRPRAFRRLAPRTRLKVHEPLCRNILLRRSRPENPWILSTNTDIVPSVRSGVGSFQELLSSLDRSRLHIAPRAEVPEQLWEGLDRRDPSVVHDLFRRWGRTLGLDEQVDCADLVLHDGPGDFQLITRDQLWKIDGFNEGIQQGWHVDGNLCARMHRLTGGNHSLAGRVVAYHCDHNRQASATHRSGFASESANDLIFGVTEPDLPQQRETWGACGEVFEEIRLTGNGGIRFGDRLETLLGGAPPAIVSRLARDSVNSSLGLPADLAFPHLASHLAVFESGGCIAYAGRDRRMLDLLRRFVEPSGGRVFACPELLGEEGGEFWKEWSRSRVVVFDAWAGDLAGHRAVWPRDLRKDASAIGHWARLQEHVLRRMHRQGLSSGAPTFLFVGSQNTWLDIDLNRYFDLVLTPFGSHVRPGQIRSIEPAWREGFFSWWSRQRRHSKHLKRFFASLNVLR